MRALRSSKPTSGYDDVVRAAASSTTNRPAEILIQDTAWPGYEEIPHWIVDGYSTMFSEIDAQTR